MTRPHPVRLASVLSICVALAAAAFAVSACFDGEELIEDLPCDDEGDCPGKSVCLPNPDGYSTWNTCQTPQAQGQCAPVGQSCSMLACCAGTVCNQATVTCSQVCDPGDSTVCNNNPGCCTYDGATAQNFCTC